MVTRIAAPAGADLEQSEGAASIDTLEQLAQRAEQQEAAAITAQDQAQAQAEAAQSVGNIKAIVAALKGARQVLAGKFAWWPDYVVVWSDEQLSAIASALEAVRLHMGWGVDELVAKFGPWLMLAMAAGMPAWATYEAIQERRAELARQTKQPLQAV